MAPPNGNGSTYVGGKGAQRVNSTTHPGTQKTIKEVLGIRVSFTRLYTPVLMLTLMVGIRVWMAVSVRPRVTTAWPILAHVPTVAVGVLVCAAILSPVLSVTASSFGQRGWMSPQVWWRSSVPGQDRRR